MKMASACAALLLLTPFGASAGVGASAENAVIIAVSTVRLPGALPGKCQVSGVIRDVREGGAFRPGQPISLNVPCRKTAGVLEHLTAPIVQDQGVNAEVLARSKLGFARLDDAGNLVWRPALQPWRPDPDAPPALSRPRSPLRGLMGDDMGYVVLDGAPMSANHAPLSVM